MTHVFTQHDVLKLHQQMQELIAEWDYLEPIQRKRRLHTLKGTANIFGLLTIGEAIHAAEDNVESSELDALNRIASEILNSVPLFIRVEYESVNLTSWWSLLQWIYFDCFNAPCTNNLLEMKNIAEEKIQGCLREMSSFEDVIKNKWKPRWEQTCSNTAKHFPEKSIFINVDIHNSLNTRLINYEFVDFLFPVIEHLIRNSVVHGIEGTAIREFNGKQPQGTIHVSLSLKNGELWLICKDDGRGFYQHQNQKLTMYSGRGVGLSATEDVVQKLGGCIDIQSDVKGTKITIKVPYTQVDIEKTIIWRNKNEELFGILARDVESIEYANNVILVLKSKEKIIVDCLIGCFYIKSNLCNLSDYAYFNFAGNIGRLYGKHHQLTVNQKKIFIVEDAPEQRIVITKFVRKMYPDCEIVELDDGIPVLDAIRNNIIPDLILCDWEMQMKDGDELLSDLISMGYKIPFIMISSRDIARFRKLIMGQGALELLGKPFDAHKLKLIADPILGR